jgi:tetratricopeptide (TPR) repeat protein
MSSLMSKLLPETELPQNLRTLLQKADAALHVSNFGYAVQLLLPVVKAEPNCLDARRKLRKAAGAHKKASGAKKLFGGLGGGGLGLMKVQSRVKKEPAAAIGELEDVLAEDPYNSQANNLLYDAAMAVEMTETGAFALETIKEGHPSDKKNLHKLAKHYMTHKEPERAADIYQAILKVDHTDGEARKGITNANAQASMMRQGWGQKENVRDLLKSKDQTRSLEDESRKGMTKEQLESRLAEWGSKYNEDPQNLNVAKRIGEIYDQLEDYKSALQWYEYAYSLSGGDVSLQAKVQHLTDRIDDLHLQDLRKEIEANPDAPGAETKKAELDQLRQSRAEKAISSAKDRIERNPTDPQLRFELGAALFSGGHFEGAIPELQRAKANPHIRSRAMLMLARCYEHKGINDLAIRQLQECSSEILAMDTVKKEVLYAMGLIHEKTGQKDKALEAFKQIYEVDYEYLDVAKRVESSYG